IPPPHLSPFVDNEAEGHVPEYAQAIQRLKAAEKREVEPLPGISIEDFDDPWSLLGVRDRAEAIEAARKRQKMSMLEKQYHDELKMESKGEEHPHEEESGIDIQAVDKEDLKQLAEDETNMARAMMKRKHRGLIRAMEIGEENKRAKRRLLAKRLRDL
ncbi:hypothetical protein M569_05981, partial [Genlisea aurea]